MKLGVTVVMSRWAPPSRPILAACKAVAAPVIIRAAKTAHDMNCWSWPVARTVMATINTVGASTKVMPWAATPRVSSGGQRSSGW